MTSFDKPDRDAILARRKLFLASALASLAATAACDRLTARPDAGVEPQVCLSAPPVSADASSGQPVTCLSQAIPTPAADAGAAPPRVCLSPRPPKRGDKPL